MAKTNDKPGKRVRKAGNASIKPERFLTVQTNPESYPRQTPWLRLRGNWLTAAGFPQHTRVKVRIMQGCLVITPE